MSERSRLTEQTFAELSSFWRDDPECHALLQFRRLATAHQYRRLYSLVDKYLAPGCAVLDWGCGNGHVSYGLTRRSYKVNGFSFEDFGLRRRIGNDYQFKLGNEASPAVLPFADQSFDAVMSVGVLEHVRETGGTEAASLKEIRRVLRPGGTFLCYHFPNQFSLIDALSRFIPGSHHHLYRYTRSDIETLCRNAELDLLEVRRYGALPRNLWHKVPRAIGDARPIAAVWDAMDAVLGAVLNPWTQNYLFAARRGSDADSGL